MLISQQMLLSNKNVSNQETVTACVVHSTKGGFQAENGNNSLSTSQVINLNAIFPSRDCDLVMKINFCC